MNLDERNENSRGYSTFRMGLDLGMGVLYVCIGLLILYMKHFGGMELPSTFANVLGGLMVVYGVFRLYNGIKTLRQNRSHRR
jgi:hypothetical protein